MEYSSDHPLPFTEEFQEAIVGYCLLDADFFTKCRNRIKPNWFTKNINLGIVFNQLVNSYKKNGSFIRSITEFKSEPFFLEQSESDKHKLYTLIDRCVMSSKNFHLSKIEKSLTGFMRVSLFKESVEGAAHRYKKQGFDTAYLWTKEKLLEIQDASFEDQEFVMKFSNPEKWVIEQEERRMSAISTGSSVLDKILGGGLFRSETCGIMAPSNVGKTTFMITMARHAVKQKKHVLFLVHEGNPKEIRLRILAAFMGVKPSTIFAMQRDHEKRRILNGVSDYIDQYLTYVPYIKTNGMYIEDVIEFIKNSHKEKISKCGHGYDIIIDDYPKKLRSRARSNQKEGLYRVETSEVYDAFNHLATELDCHCLLAVQTNRAGLRQNNGKVESDSLLGMEEIDEAYGIAQNLGNIITLNRSPEDKKRHILRLNVTKSRNAETDIVMNTRSDYSCALSFGDKEMFSNSGLWQLDLKHGFLASEMQHDNSKKPIDIVDESLKMIEDGQDKIPDGLQIGVSNLNKLEV